jgi:hydrogenase maturation protease
MKRILIAGIGNIFFGDDAFGVEVARQLMAGDFPPEVSVQDCGIRGYDLACALASGIDTAILVDATPRGEPPGTVYLIELDFNDLEPLGSAVDGHSMDPVHVLQMAQAFGGRPNHVFLVGCEPAVLDSPEGGIGLSRAVEGAVPQAVAMVRKLVDQLREGTLELETSSVRT